MGRKALTTIEEIDDAIREMNRPATPGEIADYLKVPRNRIKQRLHQEPDGFNKTDGGAYWPKEMVPALLSLEEWDQVLKGRAPNEQ